MTKKITFKVNGKERTVYAHPDMKLLDVLREELNMTGTRRGCDNSTCGACTVIVNGKAVKSCNFALEKIEGAEVVTIEGIAKDGELHPVQTALVNAGAVQCGFCTPGIVLELVALYDSKPDADEDVILRALNKHLCRCTGYEAIKDGALVAQKLVNEK
jgi:aerobic-type carbon monoxide dehydrogenase small subunit (CoxS/CutS family)